MEIKIVMKDKELIASPIGNLDSTSSQELLDVLEDKITEDTSLVIDMAGVGFMSSKGIRIILLLNQKTKGQMTLINLNPSILEVLRLSGLLSHLNIK